MRVKILFSVLLITGISYSQGFSGVTQKKYGNVHALLVGISEYDEVPKLNYAHKDAELIAQFLTLSFPTEKQNIRTLTNEKATEYAVITEVSRLIKTAKEGDLVLLYFSCHGDVVEDVIEDEQGYFLTKTASKSRVYSTGGAVKFELVAKAVNKLTSVNKAQVWFITDACKSGKAINTAGAKNTLTALTNSFKNTTNFISCAPHELSFEDANLQFGVFTYHLIKAFSGEAENDGRAETLTVDEINTYLKTTVRTFTDKKQTPRVTASNEFAEIFNPNPKLNDLLMNANSSNLVASKGVGDSEKKTPEMIQFEDQLAAANYYGTVNSAQALLTAAKKTKSIDFEMMEGLFIEALMARVQRNTNAFLMSNAALSEKDNFKLLTDDLFALKTVFPVDHLMFSTIDFRMRFFKAMEQIRTSPYSELKEIEKELLALEILDPKAAIVPLGLAILYLKGNEHEKAQKQLQKCEILVPTWQKPKYTLIRSEIITGQLDNARKHLAKVDDIQTNQGDQGLLQLRYNLHVANLELTKAEKLIFSVQGASLNDAEKKRMSAEITSLRGWNAEAITKYTALLAAQPKNKEILAELYNLSQKEMDTSAGLRYLNQLISIENSNALWKKELSRLKNEPYLLPSDLKFEQLESLLGFAGSLCQEQKNKEALALLDLYTIQYNWSADFHFLKGKIAYNLRDNFTSFKELKLALEKNPYHFESIQALTYLYIEMKKNLEADALIKKSLPMFQESAKFLVFAYKAYGFLNAKNDQYILLEKALKIDSMELDALKAIYLYHIINSNFEQADREFENVKRKGGTKADDIAYYTAFTNQVYQQLKEKNYRGLRFGLTKLLANDPMNFQMQFYLAWVEYLELDYTAANLTLSKLSMAVQTLGPSSQTEFYNLKGKIFLETKKPEEAERAFRLANQGNSKPGYLGLSMALFDQGKEWQTLFARDYQFVDMNDDARLRYDKMLKKMQK